MLKFEGKVIEWRGPAPHHFVPTSAELAVEIEKRVGHLSYGWGCIPVDVAIGKTTFYTALIPRDGVYFVPLKAAVRKAESIELGQIVAIALNFKS
jgi:hypothetical protein